MYKKDFKKRSRVHLELRPIKDGNAVAEVEEMSAPEFTHLAHAAYNCTSGLFIHLSRGGVVGFVNIKKKKDKTLTLKAEITICQSVRKWCSLFVR